MSHTQGTWRVDNDNTKEPQLGIVDDFGIDLAAVFDIPDSPIKSHQGEAEANARIMASAPDLLAACEAARQCIGDFIEVYKRGASMTVFDEAVKSMRDDALVKICAAIAQATSETPEVRVK